MELSNLQAMTGGNSDGGDDETLTGRFDQS